MDYELTLKKYIEYIVDCEGTDFIDPHDYRNASDVSFTDEEWAALKRLAKRDDELR